VRLLLQGEGGGEDLAFTVHCFSGGWGDLQQVGFFDFQKVGKIWWK